MRKRANDEVGVAAIIVSVLILFFMGVLLI
jgi:hypothetical protein